MYKCIGVKTDLKLWNNKNRVKQTLFWLIWWVWIPKP